MTQRSFRHSASRSSRPVEHNGARPAEVPYLTIARTGAPSDLIAQARTMGLHNLPRSDAEQLSAPEDVIVGEHVRQHVSIIEQTRGQIRELAGTFSALEDQLPTPRDAAAIVDGASSLFDGDLGDERLLVSDRREQQRALRNQRHMMAAQGIDRPAHYPRSRRLHLAWVAVLATIEAVGNAAFFAGLSSIGWLGGLAAALAIAALNTGSAVLVGFTCLRGLHHPRASVRRLSVVGASVYAVLAIGFNLAVGRARDLAAVGTLTQQTLRELLRHPFDLSLLSTALVGLGLVAVAVSLAKGRSLDDVVPGYGQLDRRRVEAHGHFTSTTDGLRDRVMSHIQTVPERLRTLVQRGAQLLEQLETTVVNTEKALESYESDRQHVETSCIGILRRFRSENERVRSTRVPPYFSTFPTFPSQLDAGPVRRLRERLTSVHARFDDLKAEAHRLEAAQPQRVRAATQRFEEFFDGQIRRADAGRGDPSDGADVQDGGPRS